MFIQRTYKFLNYKKRRFDNLSEIIIISQFSFRPTIVVGFSNETLDVQSLQLEPSVNTSGIVRGTVTVVGHQIGLQRICLDSIANPK